MIKDVIMASLEIEVIMKLVILANEYSPYCGFRGEFYKQEFRLLWGHLSLLSWKSVSVVYKRSVQCSVHWSFSVQNQICQKFHFFALRLGGDT